MASRPAKTSKALSPVLRKAVQSSADAARAEHGFSLLRATGSGPALTALSAEQARSLAALFAGSEAMGQLLIQHPEWIQSLLAPEDLAYPRQAQGLRREIGNWLPTALASRDYAGAFRRLRQFKQREMLRIAVRDLARLGDAPQLTREISDVADLCLDTTLTLCRQQLVERLGLPYHQEVNGAWKPTGFAVLGLGKLGGQELNYSSDVDVIFVYSEEGRVFKETPGPRKTDREQTMTSHQYFRRLAEAVFAEVTRTTSDGMLFRMDLRLRPEGDAGPLVRSLSSYENYYAQWGQTWERMMLLKARGVAGDASLAAEFIEMVQPFRYPRSLGEGVLREIAAMKTRIENEVVRSGEMERNVKLGRGGIREIEFIVQTAQLLNAGRVPFLQGSQTLPLLDKLAQYDLLPRAETRELAAAYCFLRDVEHRIQMDQNLQTHTIPLQPKARTRLARLMGFARQGEFDAALRRQSERVREIYERQVQGEQPEPDSPYPGPLREAEADWKRLLAGHGFRDGERSFKLLTEFAHGPGYVHVSQRTTQLAMGLLPRLLNLCPQTVDGTRTPGADEGKSGERERAHPGGVNTSARLGRPPPRSGRDGTKPSEVLSDPDRVLARMDSFITAYGARAMMFEIWTSHPQLFELLLLLFDRSEFLAEIAIRTPDLVDDLVLSGRLGRTKTSAELLKELRHGRQDADQRLWLRRYHQAEFMRIGLRSILGLADPEQNFIELSALADACLQYALDAAVRRAKLKTSPLVVIGLGKLGGQELTYGSDLDILFVADDKAKRRLSQLQKIAIDIIDLLGSQTELGIAFVTDTRLRPDGEKGLLVNTLSAYEEYYRHRAQLWEIQALTRARAIAGPAALGQAFQQRAAGLTNFANFRRLPNSARDPRRGRSGAAAPPAAYSPDWKGQIAQMRRRIEKERTPPGQDALAFKTGSGGLMDAEFIAQSASLEHGWQEANTLRALNRMRTERVLAASDAEQLIENYRQLRRLEGILRRWSFEGETVLPVDPAAFYRVAVRCGFRTPEDFRKAVGGWRQVIREVYRKVFAA